MIEKCHLIYFCIEHRCNHPQFLRPNKNRSGGGSACSNGTPHAYVSRDASSLGISVKKILECRRMHEYIVKCRFIRVPYESRKLVWTSWYPNILQMWTLEIKQPFAIDYKSKRSENCFVVEWNGVQLCVTFAKELKPQHLKLKVSSARMSIGSPGGSCTISRGPCAFHLF